MPIEKIVKDAVVYFDSTAGGGPDEYLCGYGHPQVYTIDVGNQPGSKVVYTHWQLAHPQPRGFIEDPSVKIVDDSHVSLACKASVDSGHERLKVQIVNIVEV